jgi:hypothetical protein
MLSPAPLSGTTDAMETVDYTARDSGESGRAASVGSPFAPEPPSLGRKSKARVLCTWKGCDHQEPDTDKMR